MEFEIGQKWVLVNGETVIITQIESYLNEGEGYTLGSDGVWRDANGYCTDKNLAAEGEHNFSHLDYDAVSVPVEIPDQAIRLDDQVILEILTKQKRNGLFNVLEFGRQVSLETTRRLKDIP